MLAQPHRLLRIALGGLLLRSAPCLGVKAALFRRGHC
jgi:hypothetical protein